MNVQSVPTLLIALGVPRDKARPHRVSVLLAAFFVGRPAAFRFACRNCHHLTFRKSPKQLVLKGRRTSTEAGSAWKVEWVVELE